MSDFATSIKTVTTRKPHSCNCYSIYDASGYGLNDIPKEFHAAVVRMQLTKGVVPAGSECFYWSGCYDGEMFSAHADKDMYELVSNMDWFDL